MKIKRLAFLLLALLCVPVTVQAKEPDTSQAKIIVSSGAENMDEELTYILTDKNGKEIDKIKVKSGKEGSFTVSTTEPGVESYTVTQTAGTDKAATYDKTVYSVDVYTTIENDVMKSEPVIYVKGTTTKSDKCKFLNKKPAPVTEKPKTEKPKEPEKEKTVWQNIKEVIKTGEESNLVLWLALAAMSVTGILLVVIGKRKNEVDKQ